MAAKKRKKRAMPVTINPEGLLKAVAKRNRKLQEAAGLTKPKKKK